MYVKIFIISCLLCFFASCKFTSPEFRRLETWKVEAVSPSNITLSNQIVFYNPNPYGGIHLQNLKLEIYANDKKIGYLQNQENTKTTVAKTSEFSMPIALTFKTMDILGGLGNILGIAMGNSIDIRVKGVVVAGVFVFKKQIPIEFKQPVSLKDIQK